MEQNNIKTFTYKEIQQSIYDERIIDFIKRKFKNVSSKAAQNIVKLMLSHSPIINIRDITKKGQARFYQYNMGKFTDEKNLKDEAYNDIKKDLINLICIYENDIQIYDEAEHKEFKIKTIDGIDYRVLTKNITYEKIVRLVCDEFGNVIFCYNFNHPDLEITSPKTTSELQRCNIQILSKAIKFNYPIRYKYVCEECGAEYDKPVYETASTKTKISCKAMVQTDSETSNKLKRCRTTLYPYEEGSQSKDAFYYNMSYEINNVRYAVNAISFQELEPGFYDCVLYKVNNPKKRELFHIMNIKPIKSNDIELPMLTERNYIFDLIDTFQIFLKQKTNKYIWGLNPIKCALIVQKLVRMLDMKLRANIQILGDASTGKSTILKYWGFLLYNSFHLSTNGQSVSIPGIRGTSAKINLLGKDSQIVTVGHLGTYNLIHIDEAGDNPDLIQKLKSFLFETNYSYDKAGADGIFHKRTAHVNICENLDTHHVGQYRGQIRKKYREMTNKIGEEEKEAWDENWDLHLPIAYYKNKYLRVVIKEVRNEMKNKKIFWIDGYEWALHERFPFYFYLENAKKNEALKKVIGENMKKESIEENFNLMCALKCNDIDKFFLSLKKYEYSDNDEEAFDKVNEILESYGINLDSRGSEFYYLLVKCCRIINQRLEYKDVDYEFLKYMIENISRKLDVADTNIYDINGPPDLIAEEEIEKELEDISVENKTTNDKWGIQSLED